MMEQKHKYVIIYLPNGKQMQFATKEMPGVTKVDKIECEPTQVNIAWKEEGKAEGESYVGMPYLLQMF